MKKDPIPRQLVMLAISNFLFCAIIIGSVALVSFTDAISRSEGSSATVVSPLFSVGVSVLFLIALVNGIGYLFRSPVFGYLFGNVFSIGLFLLIVAVDKKNGFIGFSALAVYPLMMLVILNVAYRHYFFRKGNAQSPPPLPRARGHSEDEV